MAISRPTLTGWFGMAASTHWLATGTAVSVLERGGTAVDAACAAAFVLHVVEPHLNGPGGDVPIMVSVHGGEPQVLCGQGPAPAGASAAAYRDLGLDLIPGSGPLAAAVPGATDAWFVLLRDLGTWTLADVLDPAISLARHGHHPLPGVIRAINGVRQLFEEHWPSSATLYLPGGQAPTPDSLLRNPALAATWERLVHAASAPGLTREAGIDAARQLWRTGFVAEAMVKAVSRPTRDSSGTDHAGTLTMADLAEWQPTWEAPVSLTWGDWTVHKCGPWSQGPAFLQQLALLPEGPAGLPDEPELLHRMIENAKLAMADRDAWYGDAAPVPVAELLSPDYSRLRRSLVGDTASHEWRPGEPFGQPAPLPSHVRALVEGRVQIAQGTGVGEAMQAAETGRREALGEPRGDTCQLDIVDRWGTLVAATPSGGWLQSNPVIPELGFPLGTRLQMCWLDDGLPGTLTPGRRPRTTLTPTIASLGGEPSLAFGTPGGDQQDQWTFQVFARVAAAHAMSGGLDLQAAIDGPNWHTDSLIGSFWPRGFEPGVVVVEPSVPADTFTALEARGHRVRIAPPWSEGRVCMVGIEPGTGMLLAGADSRGRQCLAGGR